MGKEKKVEIAIRKIGEGRTMIIWAGKGGKSFTVENHTVIFKCQNSRDSSAKFAVAHCMPCSNIMLTM